MKLNFEYNQYYLLIFFIIFSHLNLNIFSFKISQIQKNQQNSKNNKNSTFPAGKLLKKYQVGIMNKIPDGPLTGEDLRAALEEEMQKNQGQFKKDVGVVYIADSLKNQPLGKMRIRGEGINLLFPTDKEVIKYQNIRDNDYFKNYMEKNRIDFEKKKLIEAERDYTTNPYKSIYDQENKVLKYGVFQVKEKTHAKNLMELAIQKEQEIYKNMIDNELGEIKNRRYNKGVYDPIYRYNSLK